MSFGDSLDGSGFTELSVKMLVIPVDLEFSRTRMI